MPITVRDRKLLWARAGGTCALCKSHLTATAKSGDNKASPTKKTSLVRKYPYVTTHRLYSRDPGQ